MTTPEAISGRASAKAAAVAGGHGVGEPPPSGPGWHLGVLAPADRVLDQLGGGEQAVAAYSVDGALRGCGGVACLSGLGVGGLCALAQGVGDRGPHRPWVCARIADNSEEAFIVGESVDAAVHLAQVPFALGHVAASVFGALSRRSQGLLLVADLGADPFDGQLLLATADCAPSHDHHIGSVLGTGIRRAVVTARTITDQVLQPRPCRQTVDLPAWSACAMRACPSAARDNRRSARRWRLGAAGRLRAEPVILARGCSWAIRRSALRDVYCSGLVRWARSVSGTPCPRTSIRSGWSPGSAGVRARVHAAPGPGPVRRSRPAPRGPLRRTPLRRRYLSTADSAGRVNRAAAVPCRPPSRSSSTAEPRRFRRITAIDGRQQVAGVGEIRGRRLGGAGGGGVDTEVGQQRLVQRPLDRDRAASGRANISVPAASGARLATAASTCAYCRRYSASCMT